MKQAGANQSERFAPFLRTAFFILLLGGWMNGAVAEETTAGTDSNAVFNITTYHVEGTPMLSTNVWMPILSRYTGVRVSLDELVNAAAGLQAEYRKAGYTNISVAIAKERITNGVVTLNVFPTALPQIVISGKRYLAITNGVTVSSNGVVTVPAPAQTPSAAAAAAAVVAPLYVAPAAPATPDQIAGARAALLQKISDLHAEDQDTRVHVVSTNAGPRFTVANYLIMGNSVLTPATIENVLTNIDGAFGTNVSFDGVRTVVEELQQAYRVHGYPTVAVWPPQQVLTNATVKIQVAEGRLVAINVTGNRYFSSNNVMRALPSLRTNIVINSPIFQAELNRANANQDRQIYPVIGPGPDPGTSDLTLQVKDQLPIHAKLDFNNQNTPGTPSLRLNASAVDNNLWQLEHTLGVQYGFSPEEYKEGHPWPFYDLPLVANYSGFYRIPLGNPPSLDDAVTASPGSFGYNEATRQFRLPPSSGAPELSIYASRATIDTGLENLKNQTLFDIPFVREVTLSEFQEGLTVNEDMGFQFSKPLPPINSFRSTLAGGLDYKIYDQENYQTNIFNFIEFTHNGGSQLIERVSHVYEPTPVTEQRVEYLPLALNYNASVNNRLGPATLGLSLSANLWYSSSTLLNPNSTNAPNLFGRKSLQAITGSKDSTGYWVILHPSFSQNMIFFPNWTTSFHAEAQWASQPLISNEQFSIGGVNSVRGYHEGEVSGDTGWRISLEQQTPTHVVGMVHGNQPLSVSGLAYMDNASVHLLDSGGRPSYVELWSTGLGVAASVGSHWQARFLFSVPLISTALTPRDEPYFNFSLTAQF